MSVYEGPRLCESTELGCIYPEREHLIPMGCLIGNGVMLQHGERDDVDPEHPDHCLCGHPEYMTCDGEGVLQILIEPGVSG